MTHKSTRLKKNKHVIILPTPPRAFSPHKHLPISAFWDEWVQRRRRTERWLLMSYWKTISSSPSVYFPRQGQKLVWAPTSERTSDRGKRGKHLRRRGKRRGRRRWKSQGLITSFKAPPKCPRRYTYIQTHTHTCTHTHLEVRRVSEKAIFNLPKEAIVVVSEPFWQMKHFWFSWPALPTRLLSLRLLQHPWRPLK